MKKTVSLLLALALAALMAACGARETPRAAQEAPAVTPGETTASAAPAEAAPAAETQPQAAEDGVLVVFFSATGTTRGVAERLAGVLGAELREIVPTEPYTDADLNYNDGSTRATREQRDAGARPEIAGEPIDLDGCTTVYLGYPIWWGEAPKILYTFVESCDLTGKTIVPFCTSGSSSIGSSATNLQKSASGGNWLEGKRFGGGVGEEELRTWVDGLR